MDMRPNLQYDCGAEVLNWVTDIRMSPEAGLSDKCPGRRLWGPLHRTPSSTQGNITNWLLDYHTPTELFGLDCLCLVCSLTFLFLGICCYFNPLYLPQWQVALSCPDPVLVKPHNAQGYILLQALFPLYLMFVLHFFFSWLQLNLLGDFVFVCPRWILSNITFPQDPPTTVKLPQTQE